MTFGSLKRAITITLLLLSVTWVAESQEVLEIELPPHVLSDAHARSATSGGDGIALQPTSTGTLDILLQKQANSGHHIRTVITYPDLVYGDTNYYEAVAEAIQSDLRESGLSADLSSISAERVREQLEAWQLQQPGNQTAVSYDVPKISVAEAVTQLPENKQAKIAAYLDLLENKHKLYNTIDELPDDVQRVALELISLRYHPEEQIAMQEMLATLNEEISTARTRGYTVSELRSLPDRLMDRISYEQTTSFGDAIFPYHTVEEFARNTGAQIPFMPSHVVPMGTASYIGPWRAEGTVRIYEDSIWGAPLVVTESPADDVVFSLPNLTVFGRDAAVDVIWHSDGEWSTVVSAFDGERDYSFHVGTRLGNRERDYFVSVAKQLLEANHVARLDTEQISTLNNSMSRSEPMDQWASFLSWELLPADTQRAVLIFENDDYRYPAPRPSTTLEQAADSTEDASIEVSAAIDRGYSVDFERIPLPEMFLARIKQIQETNIASDRYFPLTTVGGLQDDLPVYFQSIEDFERSTGQLVPSMPAHIVGTDTDAYIGVWANGGIGRVYADSMWAAPLVVTKTPVDRVIFHNPNLSIFGQDAVTDQVRYQRDSWATYVTAFDGRYAYRVEVAAKLDGEDKDAFVRFAKNIVEYP